MYRIVLKCLFFICLIDYEISNPSNKTEIMLKDNTNLILTDISLHETNLDTSEKYTLPGNITLLKISMESIYCVRY